MNRCKLRKRLARIGMAKVINPSPYRLIHRCSTNSAGAIGERRFGEVLNPSSDVALRGLAGKVCRCVLFLPLLGRTPLHELEPDEVESFDQLRDPGSFSRLIVNPIRDAAIASNA